LALKGSSTTMNQSGCTFPWATDETFIYDQEVPGSCGASFAVWIPFAIVTLLLKICSACAISVLWLRRLKGHKRRDYGRRLPVVPAIALISLTSQALFWVLLGLNIVSKGTAAPLIGISITTATLPLLIYSLKFSKLGLSSAPQLRKWKIRTDENRLVRMDGIARTLFAGASASMVGVVVCHLVLCPIFPNDPRPFVAGVALTGVIDSLLALFLVMQIRRLIRA
jgi:hypothetical protein